MIIELGCVCKLRKYFIKPVVRTIFCWDFRKGEDVLQDIERLIVIFQRSKGL